MQININKNDMANEKSSKFTGGDGIINELHKRYHEIMMKNELRAGCGGYEVSFAGGKSGISFGGNQMDMGVPQNSDARQVFVDILLNASYKGGGKIFTEKEVIAIAGVNNEKSTNESYLKLIKYTGKTPQAAFGKDFERVNSALSSDYGRRKIDEAYVKAISTKATHIEEVISLLPSDSARKFYQTTEGKALLFDYHNQYYIDLGGKFMNYIKSVSADGSYSMKSHIEYIESLKQTQDIKGRQDAFRRIENIYESLKESAKTQGEKAYFEDSLKMLASYDAEKRQKMVAALIMKKMADKQGEFLEKIVADAKLGKMFGEKQIVNNPIKNTIYPESNQWKVDNEYKNLYNNHNYNNYNYHHNYYNDNYNDYCHHLPQMTYEHKVLNGYDILYGKLGC